MICRSGHSWNKGDFFLFDGSWCCLLSTFLKTSLSPEMSVTTAYNSAFHSLPMCYKKDLISLCSCNIKSFWTYTGSQTLNVLQMWGVQRARLIIKSPWSGDWVGEGFIVIIVAAEGFLRNKTPIVKIKESYEDTQLITSWVTMADG